MIYWNNEEIEFLKNNYDTMSYKEISSILGKTEGAIRAKCFDLSLVKHSRWTNEEILYLRENYEIKPTQEIASHLNRSSNSIKIKARKCGLKKYPYTCNYNFFKTIDSEEKAYWLGFICADGWVSLNRTANSGCLGIELKSSDVNHLKKFNKDISGNYKIIFRESKCPLSPYKDKINTTCQIRIYSINLVSDLISCGVTPSKTYHLTWPNLPDHLMRHFIRGYFDGDGCVRIRTRTLSSGEMKNYPICDFTCKDKMFLLELRRYLYETSGICSYIYEDKNNCFRLYVHKLSHTVSFLKYIYSDSQVYLDRKFKKYNTIIKNNETYDCLAS